ncbi:MAG TPA: metallophosphoesterase [Gemmataceae bacterium]|nr:metallophosphoesterase [Gemmataceae bacterium]
MLDAVIVSDLHLGAANSRYREVKHLLGRMLRQTRRIVFNGDLVDHWNLPRWPREHIETLDNLRRMSERVEFVWIAGNHEESSARASAVAGLPFVEEYRFVSAGVPVLCQHGHQYDRFIHAHPIMTWMGDLVYGFAQAIDSTHRLARCLKRRSKIFLAVAEAVAAGAVREARRGRCGLVATGHTHLAALSEMEDGVCYANTGCWTEKPASYLTVEGGTIKLHTVR